jgi:lysophospholipase L1-like esterase
LLLTQACGSNADDGGATGTGGKGGGGGATGAAGTTGGADAGGAGGGAGAAGTGATGGVTGAAGGAGAGGATGGNGGAGGGGGAAGASGGTTGGRGGAGATGGTSGGSGGTGGNAGRGGTGGGGGVGGSGGGQGGAGGRGGAAGGAGAGGGTGGAGGAATYMPCPTTAGTACTVLPLGDSITQGYLPDSAGGPNGGYRVELFNQAVMGAKNVTFVGTQTNGPNTVAGRTFPKRHEGHGGYTIAGGGQGAIAGSITDTAMSMFHPNIVLLMIGTNDINGNINVSSAPTRLGQLIDEIIADDPNALVVVASIIPIINGTSANPQGQTYNAAIPGLVATRAAAGKHVVFVDTYAAFVKDASYRTSLMVDNLHPNEAGYAVLGRSFYGAISAVLLPGP